MDQARDNNALAAHVAFAGRLTSWMARTGIPEGSVQADLGVGFADIIEAARLAERTLTELLDLDPTDRDGAGEALTHLGYLQALFLGEIKDHLNDLEQAWPQLEERLAASAGFDEDEDEP